MCSVSDTGRGLIILAGDLSGQSANALQNRDKISSMVRGKPYQRHSQNDRIELTLRGMPDVRSRVGL